jgi:hypothetical protein
VTRNAKQPADGRNRRRSLWRRTWVRVSAGLLFLLLLVSAVTGDPEQPASDRAAKGVGAAASPSSTPDPVAQARARATRLVRDGDYLAAVRTLEGAGLTGTASRVRRRGARALVLQARRALDAGRYAAARRGALAARRLRPSGAGTAVLDHADAAIAEARAAARERRRQAAIARDERTCTGPEKDTVRAGGGVPAGCAAFAADLEARRAAETAAEPVSGCHPNYQGACLDPDSADYDCQGGSGDGPDYTGPVRVVGADPYDLDRDGDGAACEP